jgi:uncharacterized protein
MGEVVRRLARPVHCNGVAEVADKQISSEPPTTAGAMSSETIPDFQALLDAVIAASPNPGSPVHGEHHWQSVALIGARVCEQVPEADPVIVLLFSIFHDAMRNRDGQERDHGRRGAELVRKLNGSLYHLTRDNLALLEEACAHHSEGRVTTSPTKGVCWDADRLNLSRIGFSPDPWLLSTDAARREDNIAWARALGQKRHAWPQIWSHYVGQFSQFGMTGVTRSMEVA